MNTERITGTDDVRRKKSRDYPIANIIIIWSSPI